MKNENAQTGKHRRLPKVVIFLVLTMMIAGSGIVYTVAARRDVVYVLSQSVNRILLTQDPALEQKEMKTVSISFDALRQDSRTEYNQSMMLINEKYRLGDTFAPQVSSYGETDVKMNICMQEAYTQLTKAVYEQYQTKLLIRDAYRTKEQQEAEARENADNAALPGASEHQAGLALDVSVPEFGGRSIIKTEAGVFVNDYAKDYGFIIRYPAYGRKMTGIHFEPWHIRYVGLPHSKLMTEAYITFEEYMEFLKEDVFYQTGNILISRQSGDCFQVPEHYTHLVLSEDNCGGYILTFTQ